MSFCLINFVNSCYSISNHLSISVALQVDKAGYKVVVFDEIWDNIKEFSYTDSCCFPNIRVRILKRVFQRLAKVLRNPLDPNISHSPNRQCADKRIARIFRVLSKRIHSHERKVRLCLCIIDNVKVNQLFQLHIRSFNTLYHMRKKTRNIFSNSHSRNNLSNCFSLFLSLCRIQAYLKFGKFTPLII